MQIPAFIEPEHDGAAVFFIERRHSRVQHRSNSPPDALTRSVQNRLHIGLLFTAMTPGFASYKITRGQTSGMKQPTGKRLLMAQWQRLFRQNNEDRLRDFLSLMRIADLPQGDGINQIDVPRHQCCKRFIRMMFGIPAQQRAVIRGLHLAISVRRPAKGDNLFYLFDPRATQAS